MWDLVRRMGGQLRVSNGVALGWDLAAGMVMGAALGIPDLLIADMLPEIEAVAIKAMNEYGAESGNG